MDPLMFWVDEAPRAPESDDEKIHEVVIGKHSGYLVCVHDYATEDAEASEASGRKRFKNVPYIAVRVKGEPDYVSRPIDAEDKRKFPRAWAAYEQRKTQPQRHPLQLMPGITAAELRELGEMRIVTMEALIAYSGELFELAPWRVVANRIINPSKPRIRLVDGAFQEVA